MFNNLLKRVFGTKHDRQIKRIMPLVERVNAQGSALEKLSDAELQAKTAEFRTQIERGKSLDDVLPDAFAVVREAAWRVMNMRHYDVQLVGAYGLHSGMIIEMRTGEGKTLTATSALYLNALSGRGAHLVTVNDYLAKRDAEWMGQIYGFLGMSTGAIIHGLTAWERQRAYRSDITYGTNNEFGFDYLRDNMKETIEKYVQRELNYAIVDEVDSILIDEARTPLIISGESDKPAQTYITVDRIMPSMRKDLDYGVDEKTRSVQLTDAGVDRVERLLHCGNLYDTANSELLHHVNQALRAHTLYKKDVHYLVEAGEVVIVDEFTGRKMEGRRWSDGLHQAIEAKEGVSIQPESQTLATITYQNYFRMYGKLAGMTGTADTEAEEFHKIYNLGVLVIPPNRIICRDDMDDLVYKNERGKFRAVISDIKECHERGQPVLVGTASVEKSQMLHVLLERAGIPHNVLNAKNHAREAEIIAQAGRKHAVTVATNMAGRGTDIILGGNAELMARKHFDPDKNPAEYERLASGIKSQCDGERKEVLEQGGLRVVGTERHESRRIDNQLRGRAGRQGDMGSSQFYLSLEDDLMRIFNADRITGIMERLGMKEDEAIEAPLVNRSIEGAQQKVEAMHFDTRKSLFEYDNVMNEQRKAIYALRKQILEGRYVPEILDDETRKEAKKIESKLPTKSGRHTIASIAATVAPDLAKIVNDHSQRVAASAGEEIEEGALPRGGVVARDLTHEIYRRYGASVALQNVAKDRDAVLRVAGEVVASSLIQQRERLHDLCFKAVEDAVGKACPSNVHPDEWDIPLLRKEIRSRFLVELELEVTPDHLDKLIDLCWDLVEKRLAAQEDQLGLFTMLFYVRQIYLKEIDDQWIGHLKNIEQLRTGIGLVGYATRNPKNEYKLRGFELFRDMWDSIETSVLEQALRMRLTEEDRARAARGDEYETTLTRAAARREAATGEGPTAAQVQRAAMDRIDAMRQAAEKLRETGAAAALKLGEVGAARAASAAASAAGTGAGAALTPAAKAEGGREGDQAPAQKPVQAAFAKVGRNDPCPCGSGKRFKQCHGNEA